MQFLKNFWQSKMTTIIGAAAAAAQLAEGGLHGWSLVKAIALFCLGGGSNQNGQPAAPKAG